MALQLDGKPVTMEVDTGAAVSLISEWTLKQVLLKAAIHNTTVVIDDDDGDPGVITIFTDDDAVHAAVVLRVWPIFSCQRMLLPTYQFCSKVTTQERA